MQIPPPPPQIFNLGPDSVVGGGGKAQNWVKTTTKDQWLKRAEQQTAKVGRAALSPPQTLCFTIFSHSGAWSQAKKMLDFIDNQNGPLIMWLHTKCWFSSC